MKNEDKLVPLYYKAEDGDYKLLGKISEITEDITDVIEPTAEYEEFIRKFKYNRDCSISFSVSNVNKDVLIKDFIEPYIHYEYQMELINSWLKSYRYEQMKAKGMPDRDIVIEEVYKKHCWKYLSPQ
jgi:hypothetical protein